MEWNKFNTHGESKEKAFEIFSNQILKVYCEEKYKDRVKKFVVINGAGGDAGIEAYAELWNKNIIAIQSKCFFDVIEASKINQIRKSINTAISIRKNIQKYIVCVPRDLANKKNGAENYERKRVENLFDEFKDTNIEFELWGDFEISDYIMKYNELAGVHRFWFNNSEIDFFTINKSFEIQKNGWLKERYNKRLHVESNINREIEKLIGDEKNKKEKIKQANQIIESCKEYLIVFKKYIDILKGEKREELKKIYDKQLIETDEIISYLLDILKYLKNENYKLIIKNKSFYIETEWFYNLEKDIMSMHYNKLKQNIEIIENIDINNFLYECKKEYLEKNILIIGDLGTGKTHSIANQIEKELRKNNIAILIRAYDIKERSSWKEILIKALGLSETWNEEEIFSALEILANRNEYLSSRSENDIIINKKVLICVDGIDEHSDYEYWHEKQLEANEIVKMYNNIRFCFVGRNYAFTGTKNLENYKILYFDNNPGFDVEDMFNKYMNEYNIKIGNTINIKPYLNNPLVLKTFCELYKNKNIDSLNGLSINLVQLFKIKLDKMNTEFKNSYSDVFCQDILNRSAIIIAEYLYNNNKIYKSDIRQLMDKDEELKLIDDSKRMKIIESLQKYGLLYVETEEFDLGLKREVYYKGMQPVVDYIIARKLAMNIIDKKYNEINYKQSNAIWKLCALILMEEKKIFLPDINGLDINSYALVEAAFYAIVNANPLKTMNLKGRICDLLLKSPNNMRIILNNIIIPCSRIPNHPLGAEMLNEILSNYSDMASRDKIWSLPEFLKGDKINVTQEVIINKENPVYFLNKDDKHNGLPLIYTWLLTSVNNLNLYFYRNQLMKWSLLCPNEFMLLLNKIDKVNDVQLLEQIYGIAMCLCYKSKDYDIVRKILHIIEKNFFLDKEIKTYDFQIRTYIRDIAQLALKMNIIDKRQVEKYLPPYNCNEMINLNLNAAKEGTRMGGYSSIDYDLARYVLCDHISYRFFDEYNCCNEKDNEVKIQDVFSKEELEKYKKCFDGNNEFEDAINSLNKNTLENKILLKYTEDELYEDEENNKEKEKNSDYRFEDINKYTITEEKKSFEIEKIEFLKEEGKKIKVDNLGECEFIISAAYQYLIDCGWNELEFYGKNKIDSEIRYRYYYATHGAKSSVMSFTEKYIWCFRNKIMGYLADKLLPSKEENLKCYNYSEIDDVLDPITEYEQNNNGKDEIQNNLNKEDVFGDIRDLNNEEIIKWIKSENMIIDLNKCITIQNKYLVLNKYDCFIDIINNLECTIWVSSGIINKEDIKYLQDNIDNKQKTLYRILNNPDEFSEYTNSDGSRTPFELINFDWNDIQERNFTNISLLDNHINRYNIYKTYESAYNVHTEFNEIHYKIPSKKIRDMLNINNNIGFEYKNNDETVAIYEKNNKSWEDHHNILVVDAKKLNKELNENNEILVWFIRIDKELNSLGREKYPKIDDRNSILVVCWFNGEKLKINYIKEE